ncbi:hypothetical protein CMI37_15390 [Candidatus Pacearchaeota archaeon]|nr:hypothetical protein [Candidatus Pacearchaeota archaeon]
MDDGDDINSIDDRIEGYAQADSNLADYNSYCKYCRKIMHDGEAYIYGYDCGTCNKGIKEEEE